MLRKILKEILKDSKSYTNTKEPNFQMTTDTQ